jgi:hypothetical protein
MHGQIYRLVVHRSPLADGGYRTTAVFLCLSQAWTSCTDSTSYQVTVSGVN